MLRLFAVNAEGIDSEKAGEALLNSLIPGLTRLAAKRESGASEKYRLYGQTLFIPCLN